MASVSWQKMKSVQQVKAVMRHDCKDTREAAEGHTNRDLDKSQTHLNKDIMGGYADCVARYDARMGDLPKPGRKDAVVGLGYSIPVPEELPEGQEDAWCERVLDVLRQEYGSENVVSSSIHKDERHEYTDPSNKQKVMSRTHV